MNWGLWWSQIKAVIRLEMRKTFFAKRGIWVYLLALAPAALFFADSIAVIHDRDRRVEERRRIRCRGRRCRRSRWG